MLEVLIVNAHMGMTNKPRRKWNAPWLNGRRHFFLAGRRAIAYLASMNRSCLLMIPAV